MKTIEERFQEVYGQNPFTNVEIADEYYAFETGYKLALEENKAILQGHKTPEYIDRITECEKALEIYANVNNWEPMDSDTNTACVFDLSYDLEKRCLDYRYGYTSGMAARNYFRKYKND
jgi:hypothetical protein